MTAILKMTRRTIRTFFGRFMALLLIVAVSAGFFAGLKVTTEAMIKTGDQYLTEQNFYDFRLFSTLGFTEEDVAAFSKLDGIKDAEGVNTIDALIKHNDTVHPFQLYALGEKINLPSLTAGRLPAAENECLADANRFSENDIGTVITLADENDSTVTERLCIHEYTIVGLIHTPMHLGLDRGTTNIGNGSVYTFLYVPKEAFTDDIFTEVNLTLKETAKIYSDDYDAYIETKKPDVTALCEELADKRYDDILASMGLTEEAAIAMGIEVEKPVTYVLTRNENAGYVSFENDTNILTSVANIFPIFFIAIAILVCVTTMSRMVDEERTQIGVLKAMGFSDHAIMGKYCLYAGSATLIGWAVGFFLCTWALPQIFWFAYNSIYNFAPLSYVFSTKLALITLIISLISILGSTIISCRSELKSVPAALIRPRAGKTGKRVILEQIKPIWQKLSFLQKITVRNMFRYKQRLFMMLIGIGCCAGLVVTAFGIRDSMINVGVLQYHQIQKYDIEASFDADEVDAVQNILSQVDSIDQYLLVSAGHVDLTAKTTMNSVNLLSFHSDDDVNSFWDFHNGESPVALPKDGEVIISPKIAEKLSLSVGDTVEIRNADHKKGRVQISAIFDNHIYDYIVISENTYTDLFDTWIATSALITVSADSDIDDTAKELIDLRMITSVNQLSTMEANINDALQCLNYIIWLVVFFSGALAFIVIYNLTNINIAERSREIATVQVLGFYPKETESYVLKENLILSVAASILGLPLGKLFHSTVMYMVKIDMITFLNCINPISYCIGFVLTMLFAVIVNQFMKKQINKINMTESLKAVE
ncbi:MAG: ABC transporter permease [Clostridia bacterium]|nr:ABC transporter permease [Clostridia bacterium]